jgi:virginiamycin B lyase
MPLAAAVGERGMRSTAWLNTLRFAVLLFLLAGIGSPRAQTPAPNLTGRVSSAAEPSMEGVLVSVCRDGTNITHTVVSDASGRFDFAAAKLTPGRHTLQIRAVGYELDSAASIEVPGKVDLKLRKTQDLAAQLTNAEWMISTPGTADQKRPLIECMSCHTLERIVRSRHKSDAMYEVLKRMATYAINTSPDVRQKRANPRKFDEATFRKLAAYLSSINLSSGKWSYQLKTLPRPRGPATRVLVTEYDLPRRTIAPHDVLTDSAGIAWYSNFFENTLGRLDPKTGAHTEYIFPTIKKGAPNGSLALEPDRDGNWWLATMFQTGLVRFNVKDKTFKVFPLPDDINNSDAQQSMVQPRQAHVDGKVWTTEIGRQVILRLDVASGKYELVDPFKFMPAGSNHSPYGLTADDRNNLFFMDFGDEVIGRIDAKTLQTTIYPTPSPRSRPRRTMMDSQRRIWLAEYAANKVAMFDPAKEIFREWEVSTPYSYPYDVFLDRNADLWVGGMSSDRIVRLKPETGKSVEYLLPRQTNVRRVWVDNSMNPVTFWVGSNHGASIVKLVPLE